MNNNVAKGTKFEESCLNLLQQLGFINIQLTKRGNDQGADLIGDFGGTKYIFQCKNHKKKQGNRAVQEAIAAKTYYRAARCAVISESGFTNSSQQLARPNYCLLFTASDLSHAVDAEKMFSDLINEYIFPEHIPVELDYDVIKQYENIKAKIGHTPRNADLDPTLRYHIRKKYGNLSGLISQLGDKPFTIRPSNEEIKQEYSRIKQIIGKIPTLADVEVHSVFSRNCFSSYPFTKLQKECGDSPNIERGVPKEELLSAFFQLKKNLGRTPTLRDLDEKGIYRSSYYRSRWGNIDSFLKEVSVPQRIFKQRTYQERELLLIYLLLKKALEIRQDSSSFSLNHTALENIRFEESVFLSPGTLSGRFGSWSLFLDALNSESNSELSNALDDFAKNFLATELGDEKL